MTAQLIPAAPGSLGDTGGLLVMAYDESGLRDVTIEAWPLIGWNVDEANPINPVPMTIGNPIKVPPNTGEIISPAWALIISEHAVYISDIWRGTLYEFFTWLVTNNNATRLLSGRFTLPPIVNTWNLWLRNNPSKAAIALPK